MLKQITNRGLFWELRNSIWTLWTFFPFGFFNYISFFYIATRLKDKKLFLYAVLYALPFINIMIVDSIKVPTFYEDASYLGMAVVWIISIIHMLKVRKHYLLTRANTISYEDQLIAENHQLQQKLNNLKNEDDYQAPETIQPIRTTSMQQYTSAVESKQASYVSTDLQQHKEETTQTSPLDVNVATEAELAAVNEIGPLLAAKIIHERQQAGRFTSYNHFAQILDFKPHIAHKLKAHLYVAEVEQHEASSKKQGRVIDF